MTPEELKYEIHDEEILDIVYSFKQWRAELQNSLFEIKVYLDDKFFEYFISSKT